MGVLMTLLILDISGKGRVNVLEPLPVCIDARSVFWLFKQINDKLGDPTNAKFLAYFSCQLEEWKMLKRKGED